jgi:hypothetical protein
VDNVSDEPGDVVTLWRPVGPVELDLIRKSGMRAFPPRLPEQPIFYPGLSEEYAVKIARDWNVPASGSGYVTRFEVRRNFLENYRVQAAGGSAHLEYWIPAEEMARFQRGYRRRDQGHRRVSLRATVVTARHCERSEQSISRHGDGWIASSLSPSQ